MPYIFNGIDQYAVHAAISPLGDPDVYPLEFTYVTNNEDGRVVEEGRTPLEEFARIQETQYHRGSVANLRYTDPSPINGVVYYQATSTYPVKLPNVPLNNATVSWDMIYRTPAGTLLEGVNGALIRSTNFRLFAGAAAHSLVLDGVPYEETELVPGRHYHLEFQVISGVATRLRSDSNVGYANLKIESF